MSIQTSHSNSRIDSNEPPALQFPRVFVEAQELFGSDSPLSHYRVTLLNHRGEMLDRPRTYSLDCRALSPVEWLVPLNDTENALMLQQQRFPILKLRSQLLVEDPFPERGVLLALPDCTERASAGTHIGHEFFPSVGGSTEFGFLRRATINNSGSSSHTREHDAEPKAYSFQEIVDGYHCGTVRDMRALLAAFRLAREKQIPLFSQRPIHFTTDHQNYSGLIPRYSLAQALAWIGSTPSPDRVALVSVSPSTCPQTSFLRAFKLQEQGHEHVASVRKGIDAVDVIASCQIQGRPHLVVKREIRPALAAANLSRGVGSCTLPATSLGGVAESLEGEVTLEQIGERAVQGVREEAGCEALGSPAFIGFSYPSPQFGIERVYLFSVEIDPHTKSSAQPDLDEVVDLALIDAEDVLAMSEQGLIHDPRLEISAHLLLLRAQTLRSDESLPSI